MKLNALCLFRLKRKTITKTFPGITGVLRIMKLTAILLLAACIQVSAKGHSQTVTLSLKNVPLQKVFKEINRQTGFQFFYKDGLLREAGKVDINVTDATVDETLQLCFANLPITFTIVDNTIVVKEKSAISADSLNDLPPPLDITGVVKDEKGEPVAGASVVIKGTHKGTTTDANGLFELKDLSKNDILVISGTNIETIEVKVAGRTFLNITTKIKVSEVDEIQIVGYGTTTKRMNTGTVATVKGDDIKDRPVTNVMQALQGKLSGVAILNTNAGVGAANTILIRGINSITSGTNPLIIVDGVVVNEQTNGLLYYNIRGGGSYVPYSNSIFNFINPSDIESVDVLKDADATAIYGSRGTNGVILITTKKASLGKTKVTANVSTGWKSPTVITKRMNTEQYLQMRKDAFATGNMTSPTSVINPITSTALNAPDLTVWDQNAYTDYVAMDVKNPAPNYHVDLSLSGGTKAWNFFTSGSYDKMYDVYMNKPYQELATGRMQINHTSPDNRFNLRLGSTFGTANQKFTFWSATTGSPAASNNPPNFPLYKSDGSYNLGVFNGSFYLGYNPLPGKDVSTTSMTNNVLLNGEISYSIIRGLVAKLQTSFNSQSNATHYLYPSTVINVQDPYTTSPFGNHSTNRFTSVNMEPQLTYSRNISKASFTALAGATFLDKKRQGASIKVNNPGSDALLSSYGAGQPTTGFSDNSEEKFTSVFGRLTADWDKKYLLDLNFRRDGSSRFGPNNRFANFAAAGLGWIFTSEPFLKNNLPFLSYGKLRGSYGTTGNNNIPDYQYLSLLQALPGGGTVGTYTGPLYPANYPNTDIKWENTTKTDVGMELGFLKNRILLTAAWYRSITSNLLASLPLGGQGGFTNYYGNFPGKVQNTGLEFELVTQNLGTKSRVKWTTKLNISYNTNILKSFPNLAATVYSKTLQVGRALPNNLPGLIAYFMEMPYNFTGIDPATGLPLFKDVNKDGVVNSNDYNINAAWIGTSLPTIWGGVTNSVSYKGFSLDVFLQFSTGIFPKWNFGLSSPIGSLFNPSADVAGNYWMKPGDIKKYPRLYTNTAGTAAYINPITQFYIYSSANIYKGYYVRLKNVQLSYSLPATLLSKIKMAGATVYISAENPAVYTPVKLYMDPELSWGNHGNVMLRTVTTGIRLQF